MSKTPSGFTRRTVLKTTAGVAATGLLSPLALQAAQASASAPDGFTRTHGLSVFGDLALPADFTHLNYVNPDAPKAGTLKITPPAAVFNQSYETFDTLNGLINENDAPGMVHAFLFTALMGSNADEEDAVYGLLAESVDISNDGNSWRFNLRDFATFADGSPITADDIVFSYNLLMEKGHFNFKQSFEPVEQVSALDQLTFEMRFKDNTSQNEKLSAIGIPVLSKAFYTENDFTKADLTKPLASGMYTVGNFEPGKYIEYERRENAWQDQVPIAIGTSNFQKVRMDFYRDRTVSFEAFKSGEYHFRYETSSQSWATQYDFPAVKRGEVKKAEFSDSSTRGMYGMYFNLRRPIFNDIRVREAISLMFDFEWTNENLFYGQYNRRSSLFEGAPYMAAAEATDYEKQLLAPFIGELPSDILTNVWQAPITDGSGRLRSQRRQANKLLDEAGFKIIDGIRTNGQGEKLEIVHPFVHQQTERYMLPYQKNLELIGVKLNLRRVDGPQYVNMRKNFDYDALTGGFGTALTPTTTFKEFWESSYADQTGSFNLGGIKDPILDELSKKVKDAQTRDQLYDTFKAIDRVWRIRHYWVPNWYSATDRIAHWDLFGWPKEMAKYAGGPGRFYWNNIWWDAEKAKKLGKDG